MKTAIRVGDTVTADSHTGKTGLLRRSLGAQATMLILAITVLSLGPFILITTHLDSRSMHASMEKAAEASHTLLRTIIDKPMVIGADAETRQEFAFLAERFPDIRISLAGFDGTVTYSSNPEDVRKPISALFSNSMGEQQRLAVQESYRAALKGETPKGSIVAYKGRQSFLHISPILNAPNCYHCHGRTQKVLGAMAVLQDVHDSVTDARIRTLRQVLFTLLGGLVLILGIHFFIKRRIIMRLSRLEATSTAILSGETNIENTIKGRDELGRVAHNLISYLKQNFQKLGVAQSVMRGLTIPALMCDTERKLTYVNDALLQLLNRKDNPQDLICGSADLLLYGSANPAESIFAKGLTQKGASLANEVSIRRNDGKLLQLRLDADQVTDLQGELIGVFVCILDLTAIRDHEEAIVKNGEAITHTAERARELTEEMLRAVEILAEQIEATRKQTAQQRTLTDLTVQELDQINEGMAHVTANSAHVAEHAGVTRESAAQGADQALNTARGIVGVVDSISALKEQMEILGEKTEGIVSIMQFIQDIADQTNLLALNAAIEAARAGDAGRGFAVVADEVRKLAEKTMQATVEVGRTVNEIRQSAAAGINAVEESASSVLVSSEEVQQTGTVLQNILSLADSVAGEVQTIASAMQQQAASMENVHGSIQSIKEIAEAANIGTRETEKAVGSLQGIAERLTAIMANMTGKEK